MDTDINQAPALEINGKVATIRLLRPHVANRLSADDLLCIQQHVHSVNAKPEIMVLKFESTGKYFCSGYDLKSFGQGQTPSSLLFGETVDLVEAARPITIAAVNGGVFGGGTDLVLSCDFRIGVHGASMFMPAAKLGLHFYPGGLVRYLTRLGVDQAKRLFLTAEKIDSAQMLKIGFLTDLVEPQQLQARTTELTETLCAMAPLAALGIKKHLNLIARGQVLSEEIAQAVKLTEASEDLQEGAAAWRDKRLAQFKGR
ncbi:MAG TPA: enoyl-CoA hydratase/isomerase family protein [Orrella sp.]